MCQEQETFLKRRICFPVEAEQYEKIVDVCASKNLTRGAFFLELMEAYFEKRGPDFSSSPKENVGLPKVPEPYASKKPVDGGGTHSF